MSSLIFHYFLPQCVSSITDWVSDKVFVLLQVCFANISPPAEYKTKTDIATPYQTLAAIFQAAPRIAKSIADVCIAKKMGNAARHALELLHVVQGQAWENNATIFRQLDKIGKSSDQTSSRADVSQDPNRSIAS